MMLLARCAFFLTALGLGSTLAHAGEPEIKPKFVLKGHGLYVRAVAFSPDSQMLASSGNDASIWLWDVVQGKPIRELGKVKSTFGCGVAFSSDGKIVATAAPGFCTLWPIAEKGVSIALGKPALLNYTFSTDFAMPLTYSSWKYCPIVSPDGKFVACPGVGAALKKPKKPKIDKEAFGETRVEKAADLWKIHVYWDVAARTTVTLKEPGWVAAAYSKVSAGEIKKLLGTEIGASSVLAISHDNALMATSAQGMGPIDVWDLSAGKKIATFPVGKQGDIALAFSPDRKMLAAGGRDNHIRVWDVSRLGSKND